WSALVILSLRRRPPSSTLFPYTTLFRSGGPPRAEGRGVRSRLVEQVAERGSFLCGVGHAASLARCRVNRGEVRAVPGFAALPVRDRKSTRLNSSHVKISYAVFCLKKKNN